MLRLDGCTVVYGGTVTALRDVSLTVGEGEMVALIGANGAGKSTALRLISGLVRPSAGSVWLGRQRIDNVRPDEIVAMGVSQVPEGRRIFPGLTVLENLLVAATFRKLRRAEMTAELERIYSLFPVLKQRSGQSGWSLSGGEQQMLALGRALMARPRLLLLDEPSLGLAPAVVKQVFQTIAEINREGTTVVLVEQNAFMALNVAHRAYLLENGAVVLAGSAQEMMADPRVKNAYLGG